MGSHSREFQLKPVTLIVLGVASLMAQRDPRVPRYLIVEDDRYSHLIFNESDTSVFWCFLLLMHDAGE
jgi:hypothetical protein